MIDLKTIRSPDLITSAEIVVFSIMVMGSIADIGTTFYGLQLPGVYESNPNVIPRIENGTWVIWDIFITGSNILIGWVCMRFNFKHRYLFLTGPLLYGLIRFQCAFSNVNVMWVSLFG